MTLVFLGTETTGLGDECDLWEIGLIRRETGKGVDVEYAWQLVPDMATAEPTGLRIGRYYERLHENLAHCDTWFGLRLGHGAVRDARQIAADVARLLDGVTIVGAVPDFDTRHLSRWLRRNQQCGTWHYHLVDVETLAAGALRKPPPWDFDALLDTYGLKYDEADRHTALGDARMVRDLYDAVMAST